MLNSLSYSVTFPSTGRSLAADVDFQKGFGSITGPNEAGKTFVIEMVRYCLFGTAALRHNADSYQNLQATLSFTVRGEAYTIHRDRKPRILRGEDVIAVGTKPVNEKVVEILGYGIDVFDVANVANQGDLERLGQMRPADRKRMVDNVIGLGVIEDLTKWCGDQANGFARDAEAIGSVLREPVEPVKPERMVEATEVEGLETLKSELDRIEGWLANEIEEPEEPQPDGWNQTDEELLNAASQQSDSHAELKELRRSVSDLPAPSPYDDELLAQMLAQHDAADEREAWDRLPKRSHSVAELEAMQTAWSLIADHIHRDRAQRQYDKADHHSCPACQHRFPSDPVWVAELEAQLVDLEPRPAEPPLSPHEIKAQLHIPDTPPAPPEAVRPKATRKQIIAFQISNQRAADRVRLYARIQELVDADDPAAITRYMDRMRYRQRALAYQKEREAYDAWVVQRDEKQVRRAEIQPLVAALPELRALRSQTEAYERDIKRFLVDVSEHARRVVQVEDLKNKATGWKAAKASLVTLRLLVKQHLLPSLNRVASHLLAGMTGGQRSSIVVSDDFDVMVDGQPLDTLSGSGKSVANLALRIGLGQVLTNNVFSVFIGDEIDAFMDAERAENTANTLRLLRLSISQILLVTHKYPAADFYIDLGTHEPRQSN